MPWSFLTLPEPERAKRSTACLIRRAMLLSRAARGARGARGGQRGPEGPEGQPDVPPPSTRTDPAPTTNTTP
jgi:hypothetical protein